MEEQGGRIAETLEIELEMAGIEVKSIPFRRDLIHLVGPLTREAIVKQLQENFTEGHCYVSHYNVFY